MLFAIIFLLFNGCSLKNKLLDKKNLVESNSAEKVKVASTKNVWKSKREVKKDDCSTCYILPQKKRKPVAPHYAASGGYFTAPIEIQVGAFRRLRGAEIYLAKYTLLSRTHKVKIKTDLYEGRPLYRVRIEGFFNRVEANEFIAQKEIAEAFLVQK